MGIETYGKQISGEKKGEILLFALSTCGWCRKTKDLLDDLGVEYSYIDVDLLDGLAKDEVLKVLGKWNERQTFPTLVFNDDLTIIGFQEEKIRGVLGVG